MLSPKQIAYLTKLSVLVENFKHATDALNEHLCNDHNSDVECNEFITAYYPDGLPSFDEFAASVPEWVENVNRRVETAIVDDFSAFGFSIQDVIDHATENESDGMTIPDRAQAREVLETMLSKCDANAGVGWQEVEYYTRSVLSSKG
jgi:hypothetical protein